MNWTQTKTFRVVGLSVAGAVASGAALAGAPMATAAPTLSQQAVTVRAAGSTEGFQNGSITIRVGSSTGAVSTATDVAAKRLPIGPIISRIIKALGKSLSWLKAQVVKGYNWFKKNVWDKIPAAIRWVIQVGWTVYEIFKEIYNYFF